jgi:Tol biopolymer transport system component/DNA-binding winged helix-turn-helix (wHTH) protein
MPGKIRFGVYELDRDAMELRKHGAPIRLQEQPFRVLAMLAERPGEVISREQLQEEIWGNTFVDFDQSLNKAVNRVREALNDNAGTPQYIETVPRRGYRFIAPVAAISGAEVQPQTPPVRPVSAGVPPQSHRPRSRKVIAALVIAGVLAAVVIMTLVWLRHTRKPTPSEATLVKSFAWAPALSHDGKLLAYSSSVGGGEQHIWVQQTAGGEAMRVTTDPDAESAPDFSPDGSRIAFCSERKGGGLYIASTLPGEPRLVVSSSDAVDPRFSPGGDSILYWEDLKVFTVSVNGGQPVALPLNQDFRVYGAPIWAPNGKEILLYGVRNNQQGEAPSWWIAPLVAGHATPANLPGVAQNYAPGNAARAWVRTADGQEWIIYSTAGLESWKLWRIGISSRGVIDENPELLSSGNGRLGPGGAASEDGKLAYTIWNSRASIFQVSISDRGQKLGPTFQLALPEGGSYTSPSLSRDGRWMAYDTYSPGKPTAILLRDLSTGTDHILDETGRRESIVGLSRHGDFAAHDGETSISPDGSRVLFERDGKARRWPDNVQSHLPDGFMAAAADGEPEQVCELCTPRGFSSDGSVVLLQKYVQTDQNEDRIVALDLRTRTEHDFLSQRDKPLYHAFFSWDDRWVVFKRLLSAGARSPAQILIAQVMHGAAADQAEWITVTDGAYEDDKPQFSPDGNTVYFTSTRDGYLCIWAQRLDPMTKHPLGPPFAFEHFHNSEGRGGAYHQFSSDLAVAGDKILINLPHINHDIWMTQMP